MAQNERDALGRCKVQCANCNCRWLFNQLECVKADLETTKETLQITATELHSTKQILQFTANELSNAVEELHSTKVALEECKEFASDVRTQLDEIRGGYRACPQEDEMPQLAASEAAKAALSASNYITLRLLMF